MRIRSCNKSKWQAFDAECKSSNSVLRFLALFILAAVLLFAGAKLVFGAGDQSVTLAWDANTETNLRGYFLYYGNVSQKYTAITNVGNVTTAVVKGLDAGTNWFFALTAVSVSGLQSEFSNEVMTSIPIKPKTPVIITNYWNIPPLKFEILLVPLSSVTNTPFITIPSPTTIESN